VKRHFDRLLYLLGFLDLWQVAQFIELYTENLILFFLFIMEGQLVLFTLLFRKFRNFLKDSTLDLINGIAKR